MANPHDFMVEQSRIFFLYLFDHKEPQAVGEGLQQAIEAYMDERLDPMNPAESTRDSETVIRTMLEQALASIQARR